MRRLGVAVLAVAALAGCSGDEIVARCDAIAGPDEGTRSLVERLQPGETGCLRAGEYGPAGDGYALSVDRDRVTIRSRPGERARLTGPVYVPDGVDGVTLADLDVADETPFDEREQLSVQVNGDRTRLQGLDVTNGARKTCLIIGGRFGRAHATVVRDSRFHGCGDPSNGLLDHAVYVANAAGTVIEDNVIEDTGGYAVHLYPNADNSRIRRNTMRSNGGGVIFAGTERFQSSGNLVEDNLIAGSREDPNLAIYWEGEPGTGNVARGNCLLAGFAGDVERGPGLDARAELTPARPRSGWRPLARAGSRAAC